MTLLEADHFGGARPIELAAAQTATAWLRRNRCITVVSSGAGAIIKLADARDIRWEGFPAHFIFNAGDSTHSIELQDNAGNTLRTLGIGFMVTVGLEEQLTAAGVWGVSQPRAFNAAIAIA